MAEATRLAQARGSTIGPAADNNRSSPTGQPEPASRLPAAFSQISKHIVCRPLPSLWPALCCACVAAGAAPELRYYLQPGERIVWECLEYAENVPGKHLSAHSAAFIRLWCLEQQQDQFFVLLEWITRSPGEARGLVVNVDSRGQMRLPAASQRQANELATVFYVLPAQSPDCSRRSWRTLPDVLGRVLQCAIREPDEARSKDVRVEVQGIAGDGQILGCFISGDYWFDPDHGVVTRVELSETGRAPGTQRRLTIRLLSRERYDPAWAGRRAEEARRFLQTLEHEQRLLTDVLTLPQEVDSTISRLQRLWSARIADFDRQARSPFVGLAEARQRYWMQKAPVLRADAEYTQRILGKQLVRWSLPDASGTVHTSEQVRAGVVIECLWSADTPWVFSTLRALTCRADELSRLNVRMVGLNLDQDAELGRQAIREAGAGMLHLLAGPLREVENPPRLPVVRVLDRSGVVRRVMIGWHPSYEQIVEEARRLTRQKPRRCQTPRRALK